MNCCHKRLKVALRIAGDCRYSRIKSIKRELIISELIRGDNLHRRSQCKLQVLGADLKLFVNLVHLLIKMQSLEACFPYFFSEYVRFQLVI